MIVVSDTSPLNYLVQLGIIEILPQLYDTVIIPPEVHRELTANKTPDSVREWIVAPPDWLQVRQNTGLVIDDRIDPGECAAIALVIELKPDYFAVDDSNAREIALEYQLEVIGTVGIIERAYQAGLLNLKDTLDQLLQTDFLDCLQSPVFGIFSLDLLQESSRINSSCRSRSAVPCFALDREREFRP